MTAALLRAVVVAAVLWCGCAAPNTLTVDPTQKTPNSFPSLKLALDKARNLTGAVAINLVGATLSGPNNTGLVIDIDVAINGDKTGPKFLSVMDGGLQQPLLEVASGGNLQISGVHLTQGMRSNGGGGGLLVQQGGTVSATDLQISGCSAEAGGAIAVLQGGVAHFSNVLLQGNRASLLGGGAVYVSGSSPSFNGVTFQQNTAFSMGQDAQGGKGGALRIDGAAAQTTAPTFNDCHFVNNVASSTVPGEECGACFGIGGGLYLMGADPKFEACSFSGNVAEPGQGVSSGGGVGGAFVVTPLHAGTALVPAQPSFKDCTFDNNVARNGQNVGAYGMAGVGLVQQSNATFTTSTFNSNYALSNILSAPAGASGGAIVLTMAESTFDGCTFFNNTAYAGNGLTSGKGGAIFIQGAHLNLINSTFRQNEAHGGSAEGTGDGGFGGAVALDDYCAQENTQGVCIKYFPTSAVIQSCTFHNNTARGSGGLTGIGQGGAVAMQGINYVKVYDSVFTANVAEGSVTGAQTDGGQGGAVDLFGQPNMNTVAEFHGCTFESNVASSPGGGASGGAVNLQTVEAAFSDCKFINNQAIGAGGAVGMTVDVVRRVVHVNFTQCSFVGNSATNLSSVHLTGGGALSIEATTSKITDCVFDNNTVVSPVPIGGAAVQVLYNSSVQLLGSSCRFTGNHVQGAKQAQPPNTPAQQLQVYSTSGSVTHVDDSCTFTMPCADAPSCALCQHNSSCGYDASAKQCGLFSTQGSQFSQNPDDCCIDRCSGKGTCNVAQGKCECKWLYSGESCSSLKPLWIGVFGGSGFLVMLIPLVICLVRLQRRKQFRAMDDMRVSLLEHAEEQYKQRLPQSALVRPEEITCKKELGRGGMGVVFLGEWRGIEVAVKKSLSSGFVPLTEEELAELEMEARLQVDIRHPNICLFLGACIHPESTFILTEYCSRGALFDVLRQPDLPWFRRQGFAVGTARAIHYLHSADPPIIHRDIKSLNILVDENWTAKLTDFGLTRKIFQPKPGEMLGQSLMTANIGTVQWTAPEVFVAARQRNTAYDVAVDVYSFGVVLWEIAHCEVPLKHLAFDFAEQLKEAVAQGERPLIDEEKCPQSWIPIMTSCWAELPSDRMTARAALDALMEAPSTEKFVLRKEDVLTLNSLTSNASSSGSNSGFVHVPRRNTHTTPT